MEGRGTHERRILVLENQIKRMSAIILRHLEAGVDPTDAVQERWERRLANVLGQLADARAAAREDAYRFGPQEWAEQGR